MAGWLLQAEAKPKKPKKKSSARKTSGSSARAQLEAKKQAALKKQRAKASHKSPPSSRSGASPEPKSCPNMLGFDPCSPPPPYEELIVDYRDCLDRARKDAPGRDPKETCGNPPSKPEGGGDEMEYYYSLSNEEIVEMAVVDLEVPQSTIGMGPDPTWNKWGKAFVGHPYWFWVEGQTSVAPLTDNVGPLSVKLSATLESTTFSDGVSKTACQGAGTVYRRVQSNIGRPSPSCGMRFSEKGTKTITATAHWVVHWEIDGETGELDMPQTARRQVDVRELQSVNVEPPR
ncbi:hypothetical protein ACQBAR_03765 [Propionibacteriaceae bacterium Y1685]|uniref:hypothetical protein n=1 Tax=Microlunatus sp. Y1700 TaxID=3418487 RepID=UPI003B791CFE